MTETTTTGAVLRAVTVVLGARRHDVVVDENLPIGDLAELVAPGAGLALLTLGGQHLLSPQTLAQARLAPGCILVAVDPAALDAAGAARPRAAAAPNSKAPSTLGTQAPNRRPDVAGPPAPAHVAPGGGSSRAELAAVASAWLPPPAPTDQTALPSSRRSAVRLASAVGLGLLAVVAAGSAVLALVGAPVPAGGDWPSLAIGVVLAFGGLALVQVGDGDRVVDRIAPALGAASGAILAGRLIGYPQAGVLGAAAGAALVALAGPRRSGPGRRVVRVWTAYALGVGLVGLWGLALGAPLAFTAALVLGGITLVPRVAPMVVIDAEDEVLLDFTRLSVTSWSPRERRTGGRGAWRLDQAGVDRLVEEATQTHTALLVGVCALAATSSVTLGLAARHTAGWSIWLLLAAAALGLALTARSFRRRSERVLLALAASSPALVLALLATSALVEADPLAAAGAATLAAVVAAVLALLAGGSGTRRRSLLAARLADSVESLALVSVLPLALLVAGVVDWFRGLLG